MYGMINKAVKAMVQKDFGDEIWEKILAESGVPDDSFLTLRSYDDELTYALVGASAKVLELPAESILEVFGKHWVLHTATESYDNVMSATGSGFIEFLENVNSLHDRITTTFVDYRPPWFDVNRISDNEIELHYQSGREGLSPFVRGIIDGLAVRFDSEVTVTDTKSIEVDEGEHTVFHILCEAA